MLPATRPEGDRHRYFVINKPYNMLSQFVGPAEARKLGDLDFVFPEGIHAIGRLDNNSEGLLLLTTNKAVTRLLFNHKTPHKHTYLVQVKAHVQAEALLQLQTGITIRIKGGEDYTTPPCDVQIVEKPEGLFDGNYPQSENYPHTWLSITLTEGKYHQVRKMTFAAHHRCLRLIRTSIDDIQLGDLQPGGVRELDETTFFRLLHINYQPA